jgi:hypothetical protein
MNAILCYRLSGDEVSSPVLAVSEPVAKGKFATVPSFSTAPVATPSAGWTCGTKTTCGQRSSCDEAKFYLTTCGLNRLDGDSDGVPCTKLCKP